MPISWALHTYGFACLLLYREKVDRAASDVGRGCRWEGLLTMYRLPNNFDDYFGWWIIVLVDEDHSRNWGLEGRVILC